MAFVIVEKGSREDVGKKYPIKGKTVIIGRASSENNPDIELHDDYISRQHVEISFHQNCFMLRDLESTNGTEISGQRITPGKLHQLKHNSVIGLGITSEAPRVLLRFKESSTDSTIRIEDVKPEKIRRITWLEVDEKRSEIRVDKKQLTVSRKEYDLIIFLYKRAGRICSRDELISEVWPEVVDPGGVSDAAIDQLIHRLRLKIEPDPSQPRRIISRKGFGYILV